MSFDLPLHVCNLSHGLTNFTSQVYQKKVNVENDIKELVGQMNNILSFVEDTEVLKEKLNHFSDSIQSILQTIKECSENIHSYLSARSIGKRSLTLTS